MIKYNEEMLAHFKRKHLSSMTLDQQAEVEVSDRGFVYKGELIVAIDGLKDMIVEKVAITVGDLESNGSKKTDSTSKLAVDVIKLTEEDEGNVEVVTPNKKNDPRVVKKVEPETKPDSTSEEVKPAPKKRGPKPKNKTV